MKKNIFILLTACLYFEVGYGQDSLSVPADTFQMKRIEIPRRVNNILKTNPFALLFGCIPFTTSEARLVNETTVSLYQSVYFGASYLFKSSWQALAEKDTSINPSGYKYLISGWRVQAGYKFYLNGWIEYQRKNFRGLAPKGFYFSPHVSYSTAKISTTFSKTQGEYIRLNFFNVDLQGGYQILVRQKFALDVFSGFGYMNNREVYHVNKSNYTVDTSDEGYYYNSNLKIVFGFNLGFAY